MELKEGISVLNGGRTVWVGGAVIDNIVSYDIDLEKVYDDFSFTAADGSEFRTFKGTRFSLKLKTGRLSPAKYQAVYDGVKGGRAKIACEEFSGECEISDISVTLDKSDFYGTFYYVSFTAKQVGVTVPDSL